MESHDEVMEFHFQISVGTLLNYNRFNLTSGGYGCVSCPMFVATRFYTLYCPAKPQGSICLPYK